MVARRSVDPGDVQLAEQVLGLVAAARVAGGYRLETAGYRVRWDEVPPGITRQNRVLSARPPT